MSLSAPVALAPLVALFNGEVDTLETVLREKFRVPAAVLRADASVSALVSSTLVGSALRMASGPDARAAHRPRARAAHRWTPTQPGLLRKSSIRPAFVCVCARSFAL
jgi:hypothetical protein